MSTLLGFVELPAPELVWGVFGRGLGFVFFVAISQLYHQVLPLAGRRGISPIEQKLAHIQQDYPGWRHWLYFPSLLWISCSDRFMRGLIGLGAAAALLVVYGGPMAGPALLICWLIYLSFDQALGFTYPWDCLLLEAGFLGLFLPSLPTLPTVAATSLPLPFVAWSYRWLFFRVLFGFGKYKFIGGSLRDRGYFHNFLINIPLPAYLGWYMYRLPKWVFQVVVLVVFTTEIVLPFGVFIPGDTRLVVALFTACLMVGIQLVSNFGFFNLLTTVLCLTLLDTQSSIWNTTWSMITGNLATHGVLVMLAIGGLINLPFNSWCTHTWMHWPVFIRIQVPIVQAVLRFYRILNRFRVVHAYGVFPPTSSPPIRWVPVIEGTQDGHTWHPYTYRYMTTTETSPPRYVAPYHPRLDHGIFYESFGSNDANFGWSTLGCGNPYDFSPVSGVQLLVQRLLEDEPMVRTLFRECPFPVGAPPAAVRITFYRFQPTTLAERRETGHWWTRTFAGTHQPPTRRDDRIWKQRYLPPELFHPDAIHWKRRAPRIQTLQTRVQQAQADVIWTHIAADLQTSLADFWNDFIPLANESRLDWATMPQTVAHLRTRYTWQELLELQQILSRLSIALLTKLEPHFLGTAKPRLVVSEYFQLCLFTHDLIGQGQGVYTDVFNNPVKAAQYLESFEPERSFYYLGLFWFDTLVFQARKFRLFLKISVAQSGNGLPGFLELIPFMSQQFTDIGEENLPELQRNPKNGDWLITEKQSERTTELAFNR